LCNKTNYCSSYGCISQAGILVPLRVTKQCAQCSLSLHFEHSD
jgi:hypothetical protein